MFGGPPAVDQLKDTSPRPALLPRAVAYHHHLPVLPGIVHNPLPAAMGGVMSLGGGGRVLPHLGGCVRAVAERAGLAQFAVLG